MIVCVIFYLTRVRFSYDIHMRISIMDINIERLGYILIKRFYIFYTLGGNLPIYTRDPRICR